MQVKGSEAVGRALGWVLAPLVAAGARVRRARLFHPCGEVYRARVRPLATEGPEGELAWRLEGKALARLSGAWWKTREWPDVLGFALRFHDGDDLGTRPAPGDQDLLLATIRHPLTTLLAPLSTDPHSFLANDYYAVSPFDAPGLGRVHWRLVSPRLDVPGADRYDRLARAVDLGLAVFRLEVRRQGARHDWRPVAAIDLRERLLLDQRALRFSPFRSGRGIVPRGLVHALRAGTYHASRRAGTEDGQPGVVD